MFDGIYYLISCRAIEISPPRTTLFAPPSPPPPPAINKLLDPWENYDMCQYLITVKTVSMIYFKDQRWDYMDSLIVICEVWFVGLYHYIFCYSGMIDDIIVFELVKSTGPTQINTSVDGCLIPDVNLPIKQTLTLCCINADVRSQTLGKP